MVNLWHVLNTPGRFLRRFTVLLRRKQWRQLMGGLLLFLTTFFTTLCWAGLSADGFAQVSIPPSNTAASASSTDRLTQQGQQLYEAGDLEQAVTVLQQAITEYSSRGDARNAALAWRNLALVYQQLGQWSAATEAIEASLAQLSSLSTPEQLPVLARTLDMQGHLHLAQGQPDAALKVWTSAAEIYTQLGDEGRHLRNQLSQAQALQAMGLYRRAIATLTDINQRLVSTPDSATRAMGLQLLGEALQVAGDLQQAETTLTTSLAMAERLGLAETASTVQISLGKTAQANGNVDAALQYYRRAQAQTSVPLTQAQAQLNELSLLIDAQRWTTAEGLADRLLSTIPQLPLSQASLYAQINLAESRLKLALRQSDSTGTPLPQTFNGGQRPAATAYTRDNLDLVDVFVGRTAPDLLGPGATGPNRTAVAAETYTRDNLNLVETFLGGREPATATAPASRPAETVAGSTYTRDNLDLVDRFLGPTPENLPETGLGLPASIPTRAPVRAVSNDALGVVATLLRETQQAAQVLGDPRSESYALGSLGHVYEQAQQWSDAAALTQRALLISQGINAPEISYRWQWQLGRILKADSRTDKSEAIAAYSESVKTLQSLRADLVAINPEIQVAFQESVEPIHRELVSLLLASNAPSAAQLEQARNAIESLQLAELDNFFREACVAANPVLIDQVDRQAAVFYPIILPDRLEMIVRLPGQPLQHFSTPVAQAQLETTVEQLRQSIVQRGSQRYLPLARQLYDWMIRPIAAELARSEVQTLVFVSDGVLRNIPIAVLHDGQQFLIEQYGFALTPGLQLLEPNPITRQNLSVLTAGLTEARQGFPALPEVGSELNQIQSSLPTPKNLLNQAFTKETFAEAIRSNNAPIVHLATHGQFSSNFEDTFVLTWDDRLSVHQLRSLLETTGLNQASSDIVELLVLSACETAIGDRQAALGLAGTAVQSGARSTLGSLWQVSDEATSLLISQFYQELASGEVTKAEALRRAQQSILAMPRFREHPFYWAPYILVGNWL
ncbi:MAG: CHAT domain-containing protein [Cyanobacteria bacterium J06632_22]